MNNAIRPRPQSGAGYLFQGFSLMMAPGLRRFVIIPISSMSCYSAAHLFTYSRNLANG
jgi:hypothetical protein